jgi:uncharacterized membrane protein
MAGHRSAALFQWCSLCYSSGTRVWWRHVQPCTLSIFFHYFLLDLLFSFDSLCEIGSSYNTLLFLRMKKSFQQLCQHCTWFFVVTGLVVAIKSGCSIYFTWSWARGSWAGLLESLEFSHVRRGRRQHRCWNCKFCEFGNTCGGYCDATTGGSFCLSLLLLHLLWLLNHDTFMVLTGLLTSLSWQPSV